MGDKVVWRDERAVKECDLHSLRVLDALFERLSPHGACGSFLVVRTTEVDIVKVYYAVWVHYGEHLAARESHRLQASRLDDVNHRHPREAVLSHFGHLVQGPCEPNR